MAGQTLNVYEPDYDPSDVPSAAVASHVVLHPAQPNPFNPMTLIAYELPSTSRVRLVVYDLTGRRVRALRSGETETAGRHEVVWQGRDDSGHLVATGVYVYRLEAGGTVLARRMTLVK
ncbi:MAG: T9SS type A sorting domain-containing protein [bacterium]|nr:T9SS type A sorting domain-containing protein [bacterium]